MQQFKRPVAYKITLKHIADGQVIPGTEEEPAFLLINGVQAPRIRTVATCISSSTDEAWFDDGTGVIRIRPFVQHAFSVGKTYRMIARIRVFGKECYLVPEMAKEISDVRWAQIHKLECLKPEVCDIVESLDKGDGVMYEQVREIIGDEAPIRQALQKGKLFEVAPGKLKVIR